MRLARARLRGRSLHLWAKELGPQESTQLPLGPEHGLKQGHGWQIKITRLPSAWVKDQKEEPQGPGKY